MGKKFNFLLTLNLPSAEVILCSKFMESISCFIIKLFLYTLNLIFLLVLKWGLNGFFLANILGNAIPVFFYFSIKEIRQFIAISLLFKKNKDLSKKMLLYSIPLILTSISWIINSSLDKYMVNYLIGISASGLIALAHKIPNILGILQNFFNSAWQISAIEEYNENEYSDFYNTELTPQ